MARHDREYTLETLSRLSNSLADILHQPDTPSRLTRAETCYYTVLSLLAAGLLIALSTPRSDPIPKSLSLLSVTVKSTFAILRDSLAPVSATEDNPTTTPPAISTLTSMPTLSYLRLTSLAIRHAATFVTATHDRELARNRSGRSGVPRDALAEMRALDTNVAAKGLAEAKGTVLRLKEALGEGGWLDRVLDLIFGGEDEETKDEGGEVSRAVEEVVGGRGGAEDWAGKVVESWREGVKGWGMVRME